MSVNLNTYARELDDAYKKVFNEKDPTNWACFALVGDRNELKVQGSGDGGLDELADEFSDGKIQFGICRVTDDVSSLPKVVFIAWCGDGVPVGKKGLFPSQVNDCKRLFKGFHVQINARNADDVEPKAIMKKVHDAGGAKYSIHNEPPQRMEAPAPVGSVYQRVVPVIPKRSEPEPPVAPVGTNYQRPQLPPPKKLGTTFGQQSEADRKIQEERLRREEEDKRQRERETERWNRSGGGSQDDVAPKPQASRIRAEEEIAAARRNAKPDEPERGDKPQYLSRNRAEQEIAAARKAAAGQIEETEREEKPLDAAALRRKELEELRNRSKRNEDDEATQRQAEDAERRAREAREARERAQAEKEAEDRRRAADLKAAGENQRRQLEEAERARAEEAKRQRDADDARRRKEAEEQRIEEERQRKAEEAAATAVSANAGTTTASGAGGLTANALFDYAAAEDNELTFVEGDQIVNIDKVSDDWWSGTNRKTGQTGLFPSNYVEIVEEMAPPAVETRISRPPPEPEPEPIAVEAPPMRPPPSPAASAANEGLTASALYDYEAAEDNELSFSEGDKIVNIDKVSDDWWSGKNSRTGKIGLFPCNYIST
ncbi:hypothetical protein M427DRAFT_63025 [Gonapodya prolifera JEL478]|uniref:Actin depolymerizing protein n=1 Tax=Gonapodya prolifera (strain JEL478) TaxID=1344416 RepID=A0A139A028_GONPJ|nr:hypothetical protein M427DRAFT_63025 [Gonapodya prolifera JEL478]|eukprot:KXS10092.1 hypothetical protein M427DRAFT_63025 [Gonapodya prolifera JEL478]